MSTSNPKQQQQQKGSKIKTTGQDILWIQTKKNYQENTRNIEKGFCTIFKRGLFLELKVSIIS